MSRALQLYRLQQVDSQIDRAEARLEEIDRILADNQDLLQAQDVLKTAQDAETLANDKLRQAEQEVNAQQIKIEQNQSTLYGGRVTNPKELQDLQQEAEALKRHLAALEDTQLEKMLGFEDAQQARNQAEESIADLKKRSAGQYQELSSEQSRLQEDLQRFFSEREAAASGVSDEDMRQYLKLRELKAGLAVSQVENKICKACGTTLSESLAQLARSPNEINTCSNCRRILYSA